MINEIHEITTTDLEEQIFEFLLSVQAQWNVPVGDIRVAGGWVRDKLLGRDSDDIDISLDNMSGKALEAKLMEYGERHPEAGIGKSFTIRANSDKSKHLETTGIMVSGVDVLVLGLRMQAK